MLAAKSMTAAKTWLAVRAAGSFVIFLQFFMSYKKMYEADTGVLNISTLFGLGYMFLTVVGAAMFFNALIDIGAHLLDRYLFAKHHLPPR